MAEIQLSSGKVALVDEADLGLLNSFRWLENNKGYVYAVVPMHRLIMGNPKDMHIHHINGNRLDNRRQNLEALTAKDHLSKGGIEPQIVRLLTWGPMTALEIALELGVIEDTVRRALNRTKKAVRVRPGGGKGKRTVWGAV